MEIRKLQNNLSRDNMLSKRTIESERSVPLLPRMLNYNENSSHNNDKMDTQSHEEQNIVSLMNIMTNSP